MSAKLEQVRRRFAEVRAETAARYEATCDPLTLQLLQLLDTEYSQLLELMDETRRTFEQQAAAMRERRDA